jgi:hypothetical protein
METIIRKMIQKALSYNENGRIDEAYELIGFSKDLIDEFAGTINCPSNWRDIGEILTNEYEEDSWVYENLELWNHKG